MTKLFFLRYAAFACFALINSRGLFAQNKFICDLSIVTIANNDLVVKISTLGAELQNITSQESGREYLWQGDSVYWKRRSPILFPFIGRLWDGSYKLDGKGYSMGIHGFAKDCVFELVKEKESEAWFRLTSNEQTLECYPFSFELHIGYILVGKKLKVVWNVKNTGPSEMPFQIGGHPGFNYPDYNANEKCHGYLSFERLNNELTYIVKDGSGFINPVPQKHIVSVDEAGLLPVKHELFKDDALIFENSQARKVTIYDQDKRKYLSVEFNSPVFALWSPGKEDAPFICIEPWWGRGDRTNEIRDMRQRDWTQHVSCGESFTSSYEIQIP